MLPCGGTSSFKQTPLFNRGVAEQEAIGAGVSSSVRQPSCGGRARLPAASRRLLLLSPGPGGRAAQDCPGGPSRDDGLQPTARDALPTMHRSARRRRKAGSATGCRGRALCPCGGALSRSSRHGQGILPRPSRLGRVCAAGGPPSDARMACTCTCDPCPSHAICRMGSDSTICAVSQVRFTICARQSCCFRPPTF